MDLTHRQGREMTPPAQTSDAGRAVQRGPSLLTEEDLYLFNEGSHFRLYDKLGAHPAQFGGVAGTSFAVWAPGAGSVAVIGDFNGWDKGAHPLRPRGASGLWEGFVPGAGPRTCYKYHVAARHTGYS